MDKNRFHLKWTLKILLAFVIALSACKAAAQNIASDDASAYTNWVYGQNLGFGFEPWELITINNGTNTYGGFFIDKNSLNISTATNSFAMYANGTGTPPYAFAYRGFDTALGTNQFFKVKFQNTDINVDGGFMGLVLRSDNTTNFVDETIVTDPDTRFGFFFEGGENDYYIWDSRGGLVDTGIGFTTSGLSLQFCLVTPDTYVLIVSTADGATTLGTFSGTLAGTSGSSIITFAGFVANCSSFENAYFNALQISPVNTIPPVIDNLSPTNGEIYVSPGSQLSFNVTSIFSTIASSGVSLVLNGVNEAGQMSFTGSGTSDLMVTLNPVLQSNLTFSGTIVATDAFGNRATNNFSFNTWETAPANIYIEASDYNSFGAWINNFTSLEPNQDYQGQSGSNYLDYLITLTNEPNFFRTNDLPAILPATNDVDHDDFTHNGFQPYYLGYIQNGEWEDYTRNLSNITYAVYARMAGFGDNPTMLMERTATATVSSTNQPRASLGTFISSNTGGVQNWNFVPLTDFFSNPVLIDYSGTSTFRITDIGGSGSYNVSYMVLLATTNKATLRPYIASGFPYPGAGPVPPNQEITFSIANRQTTVGSVTLNVNGTNVTSTSGYAISNNTAGTTVSFLPPALLPVGTNILQAIITDSSSISQTNTWQFTVAQLTVIPPAYAVQSNSTFHAGFTEQIAIANSTNSVDFTPNVARAVAQLAGTLTNSITGLPYANAALNGGTFTETNVINYELDDFFGGLFTPVSGLPDVPTGLTNEAAMEAQMYVQLSPGAYTFGVYSDDGFQFATGPTTSSTNLILGIDNGGRAPGETAFSFVIETSGLYPMNLIYFKGGFFNGGVELYSINENTGTRILLNDPTNPNSIRVYYSTQVIGPTLSISHSGGSVTLSWSNPSYMLQAAPTVSGTYTNVSSATSPYTVPINGSQRYFRLVN